MLGSSSQTGLRPASVITYLHKIRTSFFNILLTYIIHVLLRNSFLLSGYHDSLALKT